MNKDYVFHVNWEDRYRNSYRIGFLAELDECFYLIIRDKVRAETAYKNGFVGIPGFKAEEVYKSRELFDFFKSRIHEDARNKNPSEELVKSRAISMIDSFSVEQAPERAIPKYKEIILKTYELQQKKEQIEEEGKTQADNKANGDSQLID